MRLYRSAGAAAFLCCAKAAPEEDGPRLALADWLDERGDPDRAEFIRLQCRLAPGSSFPLGGEERSAAARRACDLEDGDGGTWLGPLWRQGGAWHRGLLAVELGRHDSPALPPEVAPWADSVLFEAGGLAALGRAAGLLAAGGLNHFALDLRRPVREAALLAALAAVPASPLLRTLTLWWPPGMARRGPGGPAPALSDAFFAHLAGELGVGQHLTHVGSCLALTPGQFEPLRAAGITAVWARQRHWPHALPAADLGPRAGRQGG